MGDLDLILARLSRVAHTRRPVVLLFDYDAPTQRYHRNISSPAQLAQLVHGLRDAATVPLLVAIDEEGGQVDRLKARYGFPATVSAASG